MATTTTDQPFLYEERVNLALNAVQLSQISSLRAAAALYNVSLTTLYARRRGRVTRHAGQVNNHKLTATEEQVLLDRIKSLDDQGFSPTLPFIQRMANLLVAQHASSGSVGKNWLTRFIKRHEELMTKYLRKYDYQRAKCEDPEEIQKWFDLVQATVTKYKIVAKDIYNFDESGFQMRIIATAKVITQTQQSKSKPGACIKSG